MKKKRIPIDEPGYRKPRKSSDYEFTVRLIESVHTTLELLGDRDLSHPKVKEAIYDLFENGKIGLLTRVYVSKVANNFTEIKLN